MGKHAKQVIVSTGDMAQAVKEGHARQSDAVKQGHIAYGAGDFNTHATGRLGEIGFARYIGAELDPDFSYEADRKRGCDVVGPDGTRWHVRSSPYKDAGLMIKPKDPPGCYVLVITTAAPRLYVIGWYTRYEAEAHHMLESMKKYPERKIWNIPQLDLHPFFGQAQDSYNTQLAA